MLVVTNLTKVFGKQKVLDNLTYQFKRGTLYVITGVSGSGKSTLLHIISDILTKDSGLLKFKGRELRKKDVVTVLQTAYLFGDLTVKQNIILPSLLGRKVSFANKQRLISLFKLDKIINRVVRVCSGGEKARTNIVRGLIVEAPITVVDEPTANVDYENALLITKSLAALAKERLIIVTSHQPQLFSYSNVRTINLKNGKLYET